MGSIRYPFCQRTGTTKPRGRRLAIRRPFAARPDQAGMCRFVHWRVTNWEATLAEGSPGGRKPRATDMVTRKLSAILAADVVGFSRLIRADEEGTLAALRTIREDIVNPKITEHRGRVVKLMGDGVLAEFGSVADAVRHAVEVQHAVTEHQADVPEDRRIAFRMGINLGDVVIDGDDIQGDGVNVAARLEALAAPGGICVSSAIHDEVRHRLGLAFEDMGERVLKNIDRPVRVWRWTAPGAAISPTVDAVLATSLLPDKPSIAVLAFNNMSADAEQEFFADGIAEEIITALSKISSVRVIARHSTFAYKGQSPDLRRVAGELGVRYVLEGSIRSRGDRIRVSAQLIDAIDGSHIWADRYDRVLGDIFDIQDEITKEIVTALRVHLTDGEEAQIWARGTSNVEAWQHCLRATDLWLRFSASDYLEARTLAERAIALDPTYAHAHALLGFTYWWEGRLGYIGDSAQKFHRARELSELAWRLDDTVSWAIGLRSMLLCSQGRYEGGISFARRGVTSHPGNAHVRAFLGFALLLDGQFEESIEQTRAAMALNPHHPTWYLASLARALAGLGRLEEALELANRAIAKDRRYFQAFLLKAVLLVRMDRLSEARIAALEVMRAAPEFRTRYLRQFLVAPDEATVAPIAEALEQAGMPK
jgi:adenylate cyclase